ncbi:aspartate carbamoyltransferase [Nocardia africana]|uniref:Aspartate carbamoyltransferase n=1 Tax=Nocardia africana TaxID=134964 RepID=A0ABW6NCK9_9NOCA
MRNTASAISEFGSDAAEADDEASQVLHRLAGRSVVSILDLTREELLALFATASRLRNAGPRPLRLLAGTIVLTAFFEPSTRTRLSFESAAHRLGGAVLSVADMRTTSLEKGESLSDTVVMFESYADVIVLRHPDVQALHDIRAKGISIPVINGGNGIDEHPTQAMADWYALVNWRPALAGECPGATDRISLCVVGTPRRMRSLRSFLLAAAVHFPAALRAVTVVSDEPEPLDADLVALLDKQRIAYRCTDDFDTVAGEADVIYQNALAPADGRYQPYGPPVRIDAQTPLKPSAVVMHPLARRTELGTDLDATAHNLYFRQAAGAVPVRQALLLAVTGRLSSELGSARES